MTRAMVTGASSGIGRATARELGRKGFDLVLVARRAEELAKVRAEVLAENPGRKVDVFEGDLTRASAVAALLDRFPEVDLVVNNAGFGTTGAFLDQDWATYRRMIDLQVVALAELTYHYAAAMKARGGGTIMNIGALAGFGPTPNFALFGATKAFVLNLSQALDFELRPFGVRVLAYAPGGVNSPFNAIAGMSDKTAHLRMSPEAVAKKIVEAIERGRGSSVPGPIYGFIAFCYTHFPRFNRAIVAPLFARPKQGEGRG